MERTAETNRMASDNPLISIIVPVYNVEPYLRQCLDSILSQTYPNWELILVDDASTDNSARICREYASTCPRITLLHNEKNSGLSFTRNVGLEAMKGELVTFIDSDDVVTNDYLQAMFDVMQETGSDIVSSPHKRFSNDKDILRKLTIPNNRKHKTLSSEDAIEKILYQTTSLTCSAWGKLYKSNLWKNIRFTVNLLYEDLDIFYNIYRNSKRNAHIKIPIYYYRKNPTGILGIFTEKRADVLNAIQNIETSIASEKPHLLPAVYDRKLSAAFNLLCLMKANKYDSKELENTCWRIIKDYRFSNIMNKKVRLKNKIGIILSYILNNHLMYTLMSKL